VRLVARAPGKVNLCLFLGAARGGGRHELVTLFESVSLADSVSVSISISVSPGVGDGADEVVCPGVEGPNIVSGALAGLRAIGWDAPPVRVTVDKRIPIAAGMGGGSADAAAVLRLAPAVSPVDASAIASLAPELGADVPSQLHPGVALGTGAGDVVETREALAPHAFVVVPLSYGLSTADVYREADRLQLARDVDDLEDRLREVRAALRAGAALPPELLINDLEPAALSLRPEIGAGLDAVRGAGASQAMVAGSGPTIFGLFWGVEAEALAEGAAAALGADYPGARAAVPVTEAFGVPTKL
jgi:4-diphosphocytidyl-2-C-methyl-D-erythritol kinase